MDILAIIFKAVFLGITLSFVTGPAMFSLIQTSLNNGFKSGACFAGGIFVSDAFLIAFTFFGFASLIQEPKTKSIISVLGGVILIIFGTYTFLKKNISSAKSRNINTTYKNGFIRYFSKGFLFNLVNPGVWFFWLIPVGIATGYHSIQLSVIFLSVMLLTIFCFDLMKSLIAYKLKAVLTEKVIFVINKVIGILLIIFGAYLIISLFVTFTLPENSVKETFEHRIENHINH